MKVLLAFATYSSSTDLASQIVTNVLTRGRSWSPLLSREEINIAVDRQDIREVEPKSLKVYDAIIFGSPSWRTRKGDGYPHEFFLDFIDRMEGETLQGGKFAIFGLGDRAYTHFCGAVDHLEAFVQELGGILLLPSLRIDGFYFNQEDSEKQLADWAEKLVLTIYP